MTQMHAHHLQQLHVLIPDSCCPLLKLLRLLLIHHLALVVVPSQEVLVRLGHILEEVCFAALLVIKALWPGLQRQDRSFKSRR